MSSEETTMDSKVETVDINLDEIFNGAPGGDTMTLPEEKKETPKQKNIFSGNNNKSDFSFADPDQDDADDLTAKVEETKVEAKEEQKEEVKVEEVKAEETNKEDAANILDTLDNETEEEVVKTKSESTELTAANRA